MTRISITNETDATLCMWLEPWGEDYWLTPGVSYDVVPVHPNESFHLSVAYAEKHVAVYMEGGCDDLRVMLGDEQLECGHGRIEEQYRQQS